MSSSTPVQYMHCRIDNGPWHTGVLHRLLLVSVCADSEFRLQGLEHPSTPIDATSQYDHAFTFAARQDDVQIRQGDVQSNTKAATANDQQPTTYVLHLYSRPTLALLQPCFDRITGVVIACVCFVLMSFFVFYAAL